MTAKLSPRMEEVVELVAGYGLTYREVALELRISQSTVNGYVEQIGTRVRKQPRRAIFHYYRTVMLGLEPLAARQADQ